jgi:MoxR-like ATPase
MASSGTPRRRSSPIGRARDAIHAVIFGQEKVVDLSLITILASGHGLLVGVPGLAKTKLVETLGTVLGLDARRVQFTPDLMPVRHSRRRGARRGR